MSYCYNCGAKLSDEDKFCYGCGAKTACVEKLPSRSSEADNTSYHKTGFILTNSTLLAAKYSVSKQDIISPLEDYIAQLEVLGMKYTLVDVDYYSSSEEWYDYQKVILDTYKKMGDSKEPKYLFIIGGDDIIPVPRVNNPVENPDDKGDKDVETDLLYAYQYGKKSRKMLENTKIFREKVLFHVSRLPLALNSTINDFKNYLQRAINSHKQGGIDMRSAHAQCDTHWQFVSRFVSTGIDKHSLLPNYSGVIPESLFNGGIILTPPVDENKINSIYNREATLFYFNLHGSDNPRVASYIGEIPIHTQQSVKGFATNSISCAENDNILVTESCYGAKHIGYSKEFSMLLSAMSNKTLLFFGSSRTSYGQVDTTFLKGVKSISSADLICAAFIDRVLEGYSAGESHLYAIQMFFLKDKNPYGPIPRRLSPSMHLTLAEFNLYGDPMLSIKSESNINNETTSSKGREQYVTEDMTEMTIEDITPKNQGLLQLVRGAVDSNINQLADKIGKELYAELGIEPRAPKLILKVKYIDGSSDYNIVYEDKHDMGYRETIVTCDLQGEIKSVEISK